MLKTPAAADATRRSRRVGDGDFDDELADKTNLRVSMLPER
jgi:hypothetical protein